MKYKEFSTLLCFLCVCSYVLTWIVLMLPNLFSRWYTLFFQCMLVVWLCLDNFTLVCDLRQAIDAERVARSRADLLEKKNYTLGSALSLNTARFRAALREQKVNADYRLAFALNQVAAARNQCSVLEQCLQIQKSDAKELSAMLRSAVELNNELISARDSRGFLVHDLLYWRLLSYKAVAMHYIRRLSESARSRRDRMVGSIRRASL